MPKGGRAGAVLLMDKAQKQKELTVFQKAGSLEPSWNGRFARVRVKLAECLRAG